MRLIKLSEKEFPCAAKMHAYFLGLTPELRRRGFLFPGIKPGIRADGINRGDWILFSYQAAVRYMAQAASGRLSNKGQDADKYPFCIRIDFKSLRRASLTFRELECWLGKQKGKRIRIRGPGWNEIPNHMADEIVILASQSLSQPDGEGVEEGVEEERTGVFRKRNARFIQQRLQQDGHRCQACGFHLAVDGHFIIDCHHVAPLAKGARVTRIEDLVCLCPNCHRIAHRRCPPYTPLEIQRLRGPDGHDDR